MGVYRTIKGTIIRLIKRLDYSSYALYMYVKVAVRLYMCVFMPRHAGFETYFKRHSKYLVSNFCLAQVSVLRVPPYSTKHPRNFKKVSSLTAMDLKHNV